MKSEAQHLLASSAPEEKSRVDEVESDAVAAELIALRASHDQVRRMLAELKYELAWRRLVRKYRPVDATKPADGDARVRLAGGFTDDQLNLPVQTFVSTYCLGSINRQLPGQFLGVTIADVMAEAQRGNSAARTCLKLLMQDRFRK